MVRFGLFMLLAICLFCGVVPVPARASDAEREAVRLAVLDYVEGVYNVEPERIQRSVHPDLAKRGFMARKGESAYRRGDMTFDQLVKLAGEYNKSGRIPKDAPKEVIIYDVLDQTATVKLVASWGIDYMHLAKVDGKWMILNVVWQTPPPAK